MANGTTGPGGRMESSFPELPPKLSSEAYKHSKNLASRLSVNGRQVSPDAVICAALKLLEVNIEHETDPGWPVRLTFME